LLQLRQPHVTGPGCPLQAVGYLIAF
jgi:hypothetical protein